MKTLFLFFKNIKMSYNYMEKIKAGLNVAIFIFLAGFIGLEVLTLILHFLKP